MFRRLSSGTRSEFPPGFHAALLLGHSPCHKEKVPVVLAHFGKQRQKFPHQQCPGSRRFQRILRAAFCGLRQSGRLVTIKHQLIAVATPSFRISTPIFSRQSFGLGLFLLLTVHAELVDEGCIFAVPVYCEAHCSHNARAGPACAGVFATLRGRLN